MDMGGEEWTWEVKNGHGRRRRQMEWIERVGEGGVE